MVAASRSASGFETSGSRAGAIDTRQKGISASYSLHICQAHRLWRLAITYVSFLGIVWRIVFRPHSSVPRGQMELDALSVFDVIGMLVLLSSCNWEETSH
jgi:hypothetical protein